jgi:hypothetical protein
MGNRIFTMTTGELAHVDLTDVERQLLTAGLMEFGGPAAGAAALAPLVGVESVDAFFQLTDRLIVAIRSGHPLFRSRLGARLGAR